VLYPPSRHRERGGLMSSANMPPHVEVSFRKGVCVSACMGVWKCYIYRLLCHGVLWSGGTHHSSCQMWPHLWVKNRWVGGVGMDQMSWEWTVLLLKCPFYI